jgi:hypothetical protein
MSSPRKHEISEEKGGSIGFQQQKLAFYQDGLGSTSLIKVYHCNLSRTELDFIRRFGFSGIRPVNSGI